MTKVVILCVASEGREDVNQCVVQVILARDLPPVVTPVTAGAILKDLRQSNHGWCIHQMKGGHSPRLLAALLIDYDLRIRSYTFDLSHSPASIHSTFAATSGQNTHPALSSMYRSALILRQSPPYCRIRSGML